MNDQSARLARVRLEDELGTLRHAEQIARAHGNDHLANALYGFGCSLGSPDAQPPQVKQAIDALRLFGGELSREQAADLIETWVHRHTLSPADVASVLDTVGTT